MRSRRQHKLPLVGFGNGSELHKVPFVVLPSSRRQEAAPYLPSVRHHDVHAIANYC
jgi:hypothetical protein